MQIIIKIKSQNKNIFNFLRFFIHDKIKYLCKKVIENKHNDCVHHKKGFILTESKKSVSKIKIT